MAEKCYEGAICTIFDLVTAKWLGRKMVSYSFHISFIYYFQSRSSRGMFPQDCLLKDGLIHSKLSSLHLNYIKITISRRCFSYDFTYFSLPRMNRHYNPRGGFSWSRKRKTLSWPESDAPEFLCVAFSAVSRPAALVKIEDVQWQTGKQGAGSSSDITLINYTYIQYIYCIYNLFQSFATQKAQDLKWNLKKRIS